MEPPTVRLLKFRKSNDLTQQTMADLFGIPNYNNYNRLERGHRGLTKKDLRTLDILEFITAHGLLGELIDTIKEG
ncbi:MAG: helix-turn-helix transcriptional regulator [Thermodesulfovibrionia bacterium]|nr:helix-turn-helix transcriptional regulator [Thermodesulfovibrionia bacterium]